MSTPDTSAEGVTCPELDLEDAALDIEHSMASDDRQTRKEYQAGCKALRGLIDEITRLRAQLATETARVGALETRLEAAEAAASGLATDLLAQQFERPRK